MKELKSRDKVTQHMSKDGLIKENQTTGKTERVSGRETEQNFSPGGGSVSFRSETEKSSATKPRQRRPSSRLQFTDEELHRRSCNRIYENPISKRIGWTR